MRRWAANENGAESEVWVEYTGMDFGMGNVHKWQMNGWMDAWMHGCMEEEEEISRGEIC